MSSVGTVERACAYFAALAGTPWSPSALDSSVQPDGRLTLILAVASGVSHVESELDFSWSQVWSGACREHGRALGQALIVLAEWNAESGPRHDRLSLLTAIEDASTQHYNDEASRR